MRIGRVLYSLRKSSNISTSELCRKTGFNKGYVYRLENDLLSPTVNTLEIYATAIGLPISEIFISAESTFNAKDIVDVYEHWGYVADKRNDVQNPNIQKE